MEVVYDGHRYLGGNVYTGLAFCCLVGREDRERCIILGVRFLCIYYITRYIHPARLIFIKMAFFPGTSSKASMLRQDLSNQCLPLEHTLFDFSNDITPVVLAHKNDTPSPSAHTTRPTESMDEVDGRVWHIV